ncbi:MAG: hypothetical protein JWP30_39 [Homoserinimonas sp.]|jgi:hypothetical protein|nr:hypothetical protein [Homoserinimonas sp.]
MGRSHELLRAALTVGVALALAGCTGMGEAPDPKPSQVATKPSQTPTAAPDPVLQPAGTASDNLAYFDFVNEALIQANADPDGRAIIDNLTSAGFDKATMQVTQDTTPNGHDVDSVQFAVAINGECLIGQWGKDGYFSSTSPILGTGGCLIGKPRPIDW